MGTSAEVVIVSVTWDGRWLRHRKIHGEPAGGFLFLKQWEFDGLLDVPIALCGACDVASPASV